MSQNMRPTERSWGRYGRIANVSGSGSAIMSDSSIALKPVIEEPSKPIPPSSASSSSSLVIAKLLSCPRMSVNQSRMNFTSRSSTAVATSSRVITPPMLFQGLPAAASQSADGLVHPGQWGGGPAPPRAGDASPDEEDLGVLRQRPEVVGDRALEDVPEAPDLGHRRQDRVAHVDGLLHEARRVLDVGVLQHLDGLGEVGDQPGALLGQRCEPGLLEEHEVAR